MYGMAHEGEKPWWMYVHEKGVCPNPSVYMEKVYGEHPQDKEK